MIDMVSVGNRWPSRRITVSAMVMAALERSALFLTATLPKRVFPTRINRYGGA